MVLKALVEWSLRGGNREADRLADGEFCSFDPAPRLAVDVSTVRSEICSRRLLRRVAKLSRRLWRRSAEELLLDSDSAVQRTG